MHIYVVFLFSMLVFHSKLLSPFFSVRVKETVLMV